jgi:DNA-binding NarL/FixJ family response regulator
MGLTNTAIANRRGTSQRTVEQRLQAVYQKLGIEVTGEVNPRVESILQYIEFAGAPSKEGS